MELKWLEDFVSLATTGNFSRSAEIRRVSQPAFSRRIRMLELWVGAELIDRKTLPVSLTAQGRRFRPVAEDILFLLNRFCENVRIESSQRQAILRFAALHTLAVNFFPVFYERLAGCVDNVSTKMSVFDVDGCLDSLVDGACDFFLGYGHPDIPLKLNAREFPFLVVGGDSFLPVSAPDADGRPLHSWPGERGKASRLVRFDSQSFLGRVQDHIIDKHGCATRFGWVYENTVSEGLKAIVLSGAGMGWLPNSLVKHDLETGLLVNAAPDEYATRLQIRLYRSRHQGRTIVDEVWKALEKDGREMR